VVRRFVAYCFVAALLAGVAACRPHSDPAPNTAFDPDAFRRDYPSDSGYIRIALDAPRFMALGDTGRAEVTRYKCHDSTCVGQNYDWSATGSTWRVEPAGALDVTARGQITARRVGDTIRANAVARDSLGRVVRIIPAQAAGGGGRRARFEILAWGGPNGTIVATRGPGVLELTARLGPRSTILRTVIDPR